MRTNNSSESVVLRVPEAKPDSLNGDTLSLSPVPLYRFTPNASNERELAEGSGAQLTRDWFSLAGASEAPLFKSTAKSAVEFFTSHFNEIVDELNFSEYFFNSGTAQELLFNLDIYFAARTIPFGEAVQEAVQMDCFQCLGYCCSDDEGPYVSPGFSGDFSNGLVPIGIMPIF